MPEYPIHDLKLLRMWDSYTGQYLILIFPHCLKFCRPQIGTGKGRVQHDKCF